MLSLRTLLSTLIMASTIASASATADKATLTLTNNTDQWLAVASMEHKYWRLAVNLPPHSTTQVNSTFDTAAVQQELPVPLYAFTYNGKKSTDGLIYRSKKPVDWTNGASVQLVFPNDFITVNKNDMNSTWYVSFWL